MKARAKTYVDAFSIIFIIVLQLSFVIMFWMSDVIEPYHGSTVGKMPTPLFIGLVDFKAYPLRSGTHDLLTA